MANITFLDSISPFTAFTLHLFAPPKAEDDLTLLSELQTPSLLCPFSLRLIFFFYSVTYPLAYVKTLFGLCKRMENGLRDE